MTSEQGERLALRVQSADLELPRWDAYALFTETSPFRPAPLDTLLAADELALFETVADATLLGNLFDHPASFAGLSRSFLAGYRRVRELPAPLLVHLPMLMAARHAATRTWLAGLQRRGETDLPVERLVAHRAAEMRRCLALG